MTVREREPQTERPENAGHEDHLTHVYCHCNPDRGLCGVDLSNCPVVRTNEDLCVVCADLDQLACERCGSWE